jgi:hypothetical protein
MESVGRRFESVPGSQFQFFGDAGRDPLLAVRYRTADRQQAGSTTGPQAQLDADASRGGGPERSGGFAAQPRTIRPAEPIKGPFRAHR